MAMLDRTERMGLFPHDQPHALDIERRASHELARILVDESLPPLDRDQALWNLVRRSERNYDGMFQTVAKSDGIPKMRRSASWALLKRGNLSALRDSTSDTDDPNTIAWKAHLISEAQQDTSPFDTRPVRTNDTAQFDITMPLAVEGMVEFRDAAGQWHSMAVSDDARSALVGNMTACVNAATFATQMVIQKRIVNLMNLGFDFVESYPFRGLSRQTGPNSYSHYYESDWRHKYYPSGRSGDESQGTIDVLTHLVRIAETDLRIHERSQFPFPQSTRGVFWGPIAMNTGILHEEAFKLDGALQIVSQTDAQSAKFVNGWFYGSFRGILLDVDGDGVVELNGVEVFVNKEGHVLEQCPKSRVPAA